MVAPENAGVLARRDDQSLGPSGAARRDRARRQDQISRLGSACRKHDAAGGDPDKFGDRRPRLFNTSASRPALAMDRRGIAEKIKAARAASRASGRNGAVALKSR